MCLKASLDQLEYLINLIIDTNDIPSQWKKAMVTPIYKADDPRTPGNYRPISVLPLMSKLLEKSVHIQLTDYLNKNNLLNKNQFGFRQGYSTHKSIGTLLSDIYKNINNKHFTKICYIDLKKAFDTVSHQILFRKMESVGVGPKELQWFKNYLSGRVQTMKVNDHVSEEGRVSCGVPQGSTLGPLLFLIYVNDITKYLKDNCNCILFADDTILYTSDKTEAVAVKNLQENINILMLWMRDSQLTVNTNKSKTMLISPFTRRPPVNQTNSIKMGLTKLEEVNTY